MNILSSAELKAKGIYLEDIVLSEVHRLPTNPDKTLFSLNEITGASGIIKYNLPWGQWSFGFEVPAINANLGILSYTEADVYLRFPPCPHLVTQSSDSLPASKMRELNGYSFFHPSEPSYDLFKRIINDSITQTKAFLKKTLDTKLLSSGIFSDSLFLIATNISNKGLELRDKEYNKALKRGKLTPRMLYEFDHHSFLQMLENPQYSIPIQENQLIKNNRKLLDNYLSGLVIDLCAGTGTKLSGYNVNPVDISQTMSYFALKNNRQIFGLQADIEKDNRQIFGLKNPGETCLLIGVPLATDEKRMLQPYMTKEEKDFEIAALSHAGINPENLEQKISYNPNKRQIEFAMIIKDDCIDRFGSKHRAGKRIVVDRAKRYDKEEITSIIKKYGLDVYEWLQNKEKSYALLVAGRGDKKGNYANAIALLGGTIANFPSQRRLFRWLSKACEPKDASYKPFILQYSPRKDFMKWVEEEFYVHSDLSYDKVIERKGEVLRAAATALLFTKAFSGKTTNEYYSVPYGDSFSDLINAYRLGDDRGFNGFCSTLRRLYNAIQWE